MGLLQRREFGDARSKENGCGRTAHVRCRSTADEFIVAPVVPAGPLAVRISRRLSPRRYHCRSNSGRLRDSGFPCLCGTCRLASASRNLRLSARRSGLCAARIVASARRRANVRYFTNDCRHGGGNGGRRRTTLRTNCQPHGLHRSSALRVRVAVATERTGETDQRQHSRRVQGRRGFDHSHDPAAEPVWRRRRRP